MIAGNTGFFLNDEMDASLPAACRMCFGPYPGQGNAIAPGKRPLSSMTPTIVFKDGKPVLVLGTPGGSRIITTVLEVIVNFIDHGMTLQEAIDAPRIHHQWLPDISRRNPLHSPPMPSKRSPPMGYKVVPLEPWVSGNAVEAIGIAPADAAAAKAVGFPRPAVSDGASDSRAPAGAAAAP